MDKSWTGIKKAVGESRHSNNYIIYADMETKKVWCNYYSSGNEWDEYPKESIKQVIKGTGKCSIHGADGLSMSILRKMLSDLERGCMMSKHDYFTYY